ncbi:hypothetical protein [Flammeovirga kamogawensis]|uniref:DUF3124 domain-containing protein n=1 Tax=Flammeovirga kamogawensis TaxID=373891 RepID=A0ABX8H3P9_9BACT|nr:hypothetical protein [Flammeovirga kamogawensis]MBB6461861.1 hypothetical protein [Flammeovirga kamogawensis]QWG10525.1 DUF3124 domain-containing protein [Flammeovirga kamogawensis]TRX63634.1 hypothetical protein EO216_24765 [Flammeovirga kamogawensis]
MQEDKIKLLLKFGESKYINDMYYNEYLYFSPIDNFIKYEQDTANRNDLDEGVLELIKGDSIELSDDNGNQVSFNKKNNDKLKLNFKVKENEMPYLICCFYLIEIDSNSDEHIEKFDKKVYEFGTSAIAYKNYHFIKNSIFESIRKIDPSSSVQIEKVNYYDKESYNGKLGYFHKAKQYEYQKEFRILIKSEKLKGRPLKLEIPKLIKFSTLITEVIDLKIVP